MTVKELLHLCRILKKEQLFGKNNLYLRRVCILKTIGEEKLGDLLNTLNILNFDKIDKDLIDKLIPILEDLEKTNPEDQFVSPFNYNKAEALTFRTKLDNIYFGNSNDSALSVVSHPAVIVATYHQNGEDYYLLSNCTSWNYDVQKYLKGYEIGQIINYDIEAELNKNNGSFLLN